MRISPLVRSRVRPALRYVMSGDAPPSAAPAVCHDLKTYLRGVPGAEHVVLDPPATATRPAPGTVEPAVDASFGPLCSFPVPERALVKIPGGLVHGDSGLLATPSGEFIGELVALTPDGHHSILRGQPAYRRPVSTAPEAKSGSFVPMLGLGARHYYHWSHDIVMRMRGILERLPADVQLIVPHDLRPFQIETLSLLGLDRHPRVPIREGQLWQLENLYTITPTLKTQIDTADPYAWFRQEVMDRYDIPSGRRDRRLLLTRREDDYWRTVNEGDVERALARHGFETVAPGRLTFEEQARLFSTAEIIEGTGAGLANMIFSPRGARVVQFQDPGRMVHALWTMAAALGHDYHYFLCEPVPNPGAANDDIRVPLSKLEEAIGRVLAAA